MEAAAGESTDIEEAAVSWETRLHTPQPPAPFGKLLMKFKMNKCSHEATSLCPGDTLRDPDFTPAHTDLSIL